MHYLTVDKSIVLVDYHPMTVKFEGDDGVVISGASQLLADMANLGSKLPCQDSRVARGMSTAEYLVSVAFQVGASIVEGSIVTPGYDVQIWYGNSGGGKAGTHLVLPIQR